MQNFNEFLAIRRPSSDVLCRAACMILSEETNDTSPEEMRATMLASAGSADDFEKAFELASDNPTFIEEGAIAFLDGIWNFPNGETRVLRAIESADESMPVVELGLIVMGIMYIAFLHYTGGKRKESQTETLSADGSKSKTIKKEYWGPTGPLSVIGRLLTRSEM